MLGIDPKVEGGSSLYLIFGNYQLDGDSIGDFGLEVNHSYEQVTGKAGLVHHMALSFFTMLGTTR
jgi:hypothetical protein